MIYSVSDKAGNTNSITRLVTVKYSSNSLFGEYNSVFTNGGTTSGVFTSTISAGDNVNQFVIYPFRSANISLKVNVGGLLGNELNFSQVDFGTTSTGYGTIENFGKRISLTYTVYTSIGNFPQTETLDKK